MFFHVCVASKKPPGHGSSPRGFSPGARPAWATLASERRGGGVVGAFGAFLRPRREFRVTLGVPKILGDMPGVILTVSGGGQSQKWGCFPSTRHLGGDFDHGKTMRPVCRLGCSQFMLE